MKNPNAFPQSSNDSNGMSLRDYFAAHAPRKIPDWFEPKLTPLPERDPCWEWCEGCKSDSDCEGGKHCKELIEFNQHTARIRKLQQVERYSKWRWHYADLMLAERDSAPTVLPTQTEV